jgi:hypothetical protein
MKWWVETWNVATLGFFRTLINFTGRMHLLDTATMLLRYFLSNLPRQGRFDIAPKDFFIELR